MAKLEWNLQEIIINNQSFYEEINEVKQLLEEVKKYKSTDLDSNLLLNLLDKKWNIKEICNNILIYGSLMYYKNVNDDECVELKRVAEEFTNDVNMALKFIDRKILDLGVEKVSHFIVENPKLEIYQLALHDLFRLEGHIPSNEINKKIKENNDKINEQLSMYNKLLSNMEYGRIKIDGEEMKITSSNFAKYISSRNRNTRKQAYFSVNHAFFKKKDSFASLLNQIYGCRIENAVLEKYRSVLEKILFDGHIDAELNENKHQSITFSWNTYSFLNFRGSYIDLKNMIHEIGHIVNYYFSKNEQPFIYEDSTIFVGEIASIVNEILLNRYLAKNASTKAEKIFYLSKEIENYFSSVFKQTMYTEFEND